MPNIVFSLSCEMLDAINESNRGHAINTTAIVTLLVNKGIITTEEFIKAQQIAGPIVDQEWARKRDEGC